MALTMPKLAGGGGLWNNPVVVRDLRVNLRGSRAAWSQAFYLGLLILIALSGYASTTSNGARDPITVQRNLQSFYSFIFYTVAALIMLIAPALTAVSIVSERQRLTLDLLVTTPMSSMQMLTGKLVSSVAFLLLLLMMSIPASALCVILGGATLGDVLRTYALLAIDGIVVAAIGLAFSCTAKNNVQAIVGTYGALGLSFAALAPIASMSMVRTVSYGLRGTIPPAPVAASIAALNPVYAVMQSSSLVIVAGLTVPIWVAALICAFVIVRLLITASALRLGLYGGGLIKSLRVQILLATFLALFILGSSLVSLGPSASGILSSYAMISIPVLLTLAFAVGSFFLPSLFVPVTDEESNEQQAVRGVYSVRRMFGPEHAGSLPYFHAWLITATVGLLVGLLVWSSPYTSSVAVLPGTPIVYHSASASGLALATLCGVFYISGLGFLVWSVARRISWLSASYMTARPITFLVMVALVVAPFAIMMSVYQASMPQYYNTGSPFQGFVDHLWLLYPFTTFDSHPPITHWPAYFQTGGLAYLLGVLFYPFWRPVVPGQASRASRRMPLTTPSDAPAATGAKG